MLSFTACFEAPVDEEEVISTTTSSEGSVASPVGLAVGSTHNAKVGGELGYDSSYYSFTTSSAGDYTVTVSSLSGSVVIGIIGYDNSTFSSMINIDAWSDNESNPGGNVTVTLTGLSASTSYYLSVYNDYYQDVTFNLSVALTNATSATSVIAQNVSATDGTYSDRIVITWDAVAGATGYFISVEDDNGGTGAYIATSNTYTDYIVSSDYLYSYSVQAMVDGVTEDASASDTGYVSGYSGSGVVVPDSTSGGNLTLGTQITGNIATAGDIIWYSFDATVGTDYQISWEDEYEQAASTYTLDVKVSVYRENNVTAYFTDNDSGYSSPKNITALATEKVMIKVEAYSSTYTTGTFALTATTEAPVVAANEGTVSSPIELTLDAVRSAKIGAETSSDNYSYYSFTTTIAGDYNVSSSLSSSEIYFYLYSGSIDDTYVDGTVIGDSRIFALAPSTTYYLKPRSYTATDATFDLLVTTPSPIAATALTLGTQTSGNIATAGDIVWFSFDAIAGASYQIAWEDYYDQAASIYTGAVKVSAYREDAFISYFTPIDNGYGFPPSITALASEKVMIKVEGYSSTTSIGTFAITATQQ